MGLIKNIISYFKQLSNRNMISLPLPTKNTEADEKQPKISKEQEEQEPEISEKNIVMFLYKQMRLGKLEPKYIPDEYREKIVALLKEEKTIKQKQIVEIKQKIRR